MTLGIPSSLADHGRMVSTPIRLVPADMPEAASLPQNVEAEAALLGALMIDNRLVEDVPIRLTPELFFSPLHGRIYESSEEHTSELQTLMSIQYAAFPLQKKTSCNT